MLILLQSLPLPVLVPKELATKAAICFCYNTIKVSDLSLSFRAVAGLSQLYQLTLTPIFAFAMSRSPSVGLVSSLSGSRCRRVLSQIDQPVIQMNLASSNNSSNGLADLWTAQSGDLNSLLSCSSLQPTE